jgi:hypothetical protein
LKDIVLFQLAAGRELAALRRHRLYLVDDILLVSEQRVPRLAILFAFVRVT